MRARRGMALFLVLALAFLLLLIVTGVFQQGQDAVAQASRAEGRVALSNLLANAAAEGWWHVMNPGMYPPPPKAADAAPVALYRDVRSTAPGGASVSLPVALTPRASRSRLPVGGELFLGDTTARARDRIQRDGVSQGLIELRTSGTFTHERVSVRLALVQTRAYWLAGDPRAPRVTIGEELVAQSVEEIR
jgi:hypothetical protein